MRRAVLSLLAFVSACLFLLPTLVPASEMVFTFDFDPSDLVFEKVDGYDRVKMAEARFPAEPGTPSLPVRFVQIAIPADLEVEKVEVVFSESQDLPGTYKLYPAQRFYPVSSLPTKEEEVEFVEPDPAVYSLSTEYPGETARVTNNGFLGSQHIAGLALYPLQYVPAEGTLILYTRIEFKLVFRSAFHSPAPVNRRSRGTAQFYSNLARSVVINPEVVQLEAEGPMSQDEEVDYLIITDDSMVSIFQELADWKTKRGIATEVRRIAWVISNYDGYDEQEKIRNCIRDYYSNRGTKWVLLGGDTPIMPHRVAPVMGEHIPCDLYFSDLDSNWDANGNHIYGEYEDEVDMYPDVFVGRAPSNDVSQAQTFVDKCLTCETNPPTDYQTKILYAAEVLWPGTDAAVLKNYIDSSFVPDYFEAIKLYETSGNLNRATFAAGLNEGQNIINHNGHGNSDRISIGSETWYSSDMDALVNAPRHSLFYTYGCITAAIDLDCIAEHFVNNPDGGGFAYCGNTRYGWGVPGAPLEGPGAEFDIEFFRALFDSANYQVGKTLGNSKIPFIPIAQEPTGDGPYYRWTMYTLLLLGDPTTELWTNTPAELAVSHAPVLFAGMDYFEVNVVQDGALASCTKDGEILGTAYSSGGTAVVYFDSPVLTMGTMHVTVTKHDYIPYHDTVLVIPPEGPYVIYNAHQTDDSQGNGNGVVNPDETILMSITVKNIGIEDARNVSATLRTEDQWILVTDSVQSFGDIDSGMTAVSLGDYVFQTDAFCPDSHVVRFDLEATNGDTSWVTSFFQMVVEPDFVITASSDTVVVPQGDSSFVKLTFNSLGGFNWLVDLSHTVLPTGVSGFLDPDQLIPPDSSIFRLYGAPDASPGLHPVTITATGGGISRENEVVLGIVPPPYYGPVWHASPQGHDFIGNGSEEFPFRSIQKCIDYASSGDTVLAAAGLYMENIDFTGKAILLASHFILDGRESSIESTIIDGNRRGSVVSCHSDEDSNSVIRGFTLTGGYASYGGGVYCNNSSPTLADNFIVNNECVPGHGGPAIYCGHGSNATIRRNLIANCTGPAAVFLHIESDAQLINNTICDNSWGAMSIQGYSDPLVKNNILYNNYYYGIHVADGSPVISYNDVYGSDDNYLGIDDQTGINGNISTDPLFLHPDTGDYHLTGGSPCIDAGDPADSVPPGGGDRIDMGAFEFVHGPYVSYHSHQIDDSAGNNNGLVNPGETIAMPITVQNTGTQTACGVSGILRTDDDFVVVTDSIKEFGDIDSGATAISMGDYWFEVDSSCPNLYQVTFELKLTDDSATWISTFVETVTDTDFVVTLAPPTVAILPGDSGRVNVILTSLGGFGSEVNLSHSELPPGVTSVLDPDHLIPTDSSVLRLNATLEVSMGSYPITVIASGGGITHQEVFDLAIVGRGDVNRDGEINAADVVFLLAYLYRGGPPPEPLELGDANADGYVNSADIVYLIQYLYRGGPPPPAKYDRLPGTQLNQLPAQLWLASAGGAGAEGAQQILIRGTSAVDIAAVELTIEYHPQNSSLSPVLPGHLQNLQIFSMQKQGILKVGLLDLKGESWITAGEGVDLLILNTKGTDLSRLWIKEVVLADRHGWMVPVKIVTQEEIERSRPESFSLSQNHPNPFNPRTQITYALPVDCEVKISVYNVLGQQVRVLVDERQAAGHKRVCWDGKDERGLELSSGIYFYRIQAGEFVQTKKMLLLK